MKLSVIIVNYNVKHFLEQCLCSLLKACRNIQAEILVVDNCSTDGSRKYLEYAFPTVSFTWNTENLGFSKANNQALKQAKGEFILFLNPDTILAEDSLQLCMEFFATHADAGGLGVRMIDGAGKFLKESKRAFPSYFTSFCKLSGLARLFPSSKIFNRYYLGYLPEHENHEVDVLAGAFMMIPARVIEQTGGFDETFFMYGEDVDLSYRIQKAGFKNYYFAGTTIIHFKGESTKKGSLNYIRLFYNAMSLFVKKHYSGSSAGLFVFFVHVGIWLRAGVSAFSKFIRRIGLPLIDAAIILFSFWLTKWWWASYIKVEAGYSPNILVVAFPVFTLIFLTASFFSGLYDKGFKQRQLNRSTIIASLVLFSSYLLLPADFRFSRGILFFGIVSAFILMSITRWLFLKMGVLEKQEEQENRQTIIVSNSSDYSTVLELMQKAAMHERVLGRISSTGNGDNAIGTVDQISAMVKTYAVKELVFCEDGLDFRSIIGLIDKMPGGIRYMFHASGSNSIVGSESKDVSGEYISSDKKFDITRPANKRNKRTLDIILSCLLLISFPVHLFLQKKRMGFFQNMLQVLAGKKTFVGYASAQNNFPPIKKGILSSTALPVQMNKLPQESLLASDEWYATSWLVWGDIRRIWRGYRLLGY